MLVIGIKSFRNIIVFLFFERGTTLANLLPLGKQPLVSEKFMTCVNGTKMKGIASLSIFAVTALSATGLHLILWEAFFIHLYPEVLDGRSIRVCLTLRCKFQYLLIQNIFNSN